MMKVISDRAFSLSISHQRSPSVLPHQTHLASRVQSVATAPGLCQHLRRRGDFRLYQTRQRSSRVQVQAVAEEVQDGLRTLYPTQAGGPHASGFLQVSHSHQVYYEVHGNPQGRPALVVHGGPGAGCYPNHARFFDPAYYRIVLLDQRGCGRSTPRGGLEGNTTQGLVQDMEDLRVHLGLRRWLLFGGSWGVALSLAYAQAHPDAVAGLVLRGVCLMRRSEIDWMFRGGVEALQPKGWRDFVGILTPEERADPVAAYYQRMTSGDAAARVEASRAWFALNSAAGSGGRQPLLQVWSGSCWNMSDFPPPGGAAGAHSLPPPPPSTTAALASAANKPAAVAAAAAGADASTATAAGPVGSSSSVGPSLKGPAAEGGRGEGTSGGAGSSSGSSTAASSAAASATPAAGSPAAVSAVIPCAPPGSTNGSGGSSSVAGGKGQGKGGGGQLAGSVGPLLEAHYCHHDAFLSDSPLLEGVPSLRHLPCIAVHGRLDFVCPVRTAYDLHCEWPEMELRVVPGAGHSMYDPAITHELVQATDRMRALPAERWGSGAGGGGGSGQDQGGSNGGEGRSSRGAKRQQQGADPCDARQPEGAVGHAAPAAAAAV